MYQIELANKIEHGRCVGNLYIVTRRPVGQTATILVCNTREEAQAQLDEWLDHDAYHAYHPACEDEGLESHTMRAWKIHGKPTGPV